MLKNKCSDILCSLFSINLVKRPNQYWIDPNNKCYLCSKTWWLHCPKTGTGSHVVSSQWTHTVVCLDSVVLLEILPVKQPVCINLQLKPVSDKWKKPCSKWQCPAVARRLLSFLNKETIHVWATFKKLLQLLHVFQWQCTWMSISQMYHC